jgi:murein DD-endopeptidase MepM/ murein hydrolase activator NlpD
MRVSLCGKHQRVLARGAAVLLLGGLTAGCSSSAMRFGGVTDGLYTGATDNQRAIINNNQQPYPGDVQTAGNREAVQPVDVSSGQVSKRSLPPVSSNQVAAVEPAPARVAEPAPVAQPRVAAEAKPRLDETATGTMEAAAPAEENVKGWSRAGGTQVTAKEGETVYNLSRRFGVPADIIMKVNGISAENGLKTGQKVVIPTYVYSAKAGVSAPDNDPKTAEAKSSRGVKPAEVPVPAQAPADNVAVLPNGPKVKEADSAATESAPAKQAKAASADGAYTVAEGDTLHKIARKTGVSVTALKEANGLKDGNIRIGQKLSLKPGAAATVAAAKPAEAKPANVDTATKTASIPAAEQKPDAGKVAEYTPPKKADKAIAEAEKDSDDAAPESTGIGKMRWPVRGKVVQGYGGGKSDGIDIAVPNGTPVKAAENGVVIYAGDGLKEFGNTVLVRHENGLVTVYGHASELKVQRGQKVKRGDEIAVSGMSGDAKAPKLHFEVRKNSAPIDPSSFLE